MNDDDDDDVDGDGDDDDDVFCDTSYRAGMYLQKKAVRELRLMFDTTAYFDSEQITSILMVSTSFLFVRLSVCCMQPSDCLSVFVIDSL